jgi:hypothetical protein
MVGKTPADVTGRTASETAGMVASETLASVIAGRVAVDAGIDMDVVWEDGSDTM